MVPSQRVVYQRPAEADAAAAVGKREEKESHSRHMSSKASFGVSHRRENAGQVDGDGEYDYNEQNDDMGREDMQ